MMWYVFLYIQIFILYDDFMWWWSHEMAKCLIHTYIYNDFVMMICHEDMVMLRSTTGPYGWPVTEVAYEEMMFSLHRGCVGDNSSEKVVRMSAWCIVHVWHTQVNISISSIYIIFLGFQDIKTYVYVYCFQNLYAV